VSWSAIDNQVDDRQDNRGSQTYGGRGDGQSENTACKQKHAQHGKVHAFIHFQDEITEDEGYGSNYKTPINPHAHGLVLLRGKLLRRYHELSKEATVSIRVTGHRSYWW
jgi:spore cortex formation protein SpoVR/YcgB (stage V sporulation)